MPSLIAPPNKPHIGENNMDPNVEQVEEVERNSVPGQAFRFLNLPSELRIRVYELLLGIEDTIDLDPLNHRRLGPLMVIFLANRQIYEEAFRIFYSKNVFRLFSTNGKFFHAKNQLLSRLTPTYRSTITTLELRLGPGWSAPPKRWIVNNKLGLDDCKFLRLLKVFVELDPSGHEIFKDFRLPDDLYSRFCTGLLKKVLVKVPSIVEIQFDGYPSVKRSGSLMTALLAEAITAKKMITYGPQRGWSEEVDSEPDTDGSKDPEKALMTGGLTKSMATTVPITFVQA